MAAHGSHGASASEALAWVEDAAGWRLDIDVVGELLVAVDGDRAALEQAVLRADDPTELLGRPHRPLDVLAPPVGLDPVIASLDDAAVRLALLHCIGAGDPTGVASAVEAVDDADQARAEALDAGLLRRIPGGIATPDATTSANLWHQATERQRMWALRALVDGTEDDEARTWYRAWAAVGPDADVSDQLAVASEEALARGATVDAASALEIGAALVPDREQAVPMLLRAAEMYFVAGLARHALALLRRTVDSATDPAAAAMMHRMIGRVLLFDGDMRAAEAHLLAHARHFGDAHHDLGMLLAAEALWVRAVDGRLAEGLPLISENGPPAEDAPLFVRSCWTGLRNMIGVGVDRTELEVRHAEFDSMAADDPEHGMIGYVILHAAIGLEAHDIAEAVLATLLQGEVRQGAIAHQALVLSGASELAWWRNDWTAARSWALEAIDLAARRRDTISPARAVLTLARIQYASDEADDAERMIDAHLATVPGWSRPALLAARGHGHLIAGRIDRAIADLEAAIDAETQPVHGLPHPKLSGVGPDYCTALVEAGRLGDAAAWLDRWRSNPAATGSWERGVARRCDALITTGPDAIEAGSDAVTLLDGFTFDQARGMLEQGRRQLDDDDVDGARRSLRAALPRFVGLGATTWARSTEVSLDRIAGRGQASVERALARLSEQDRRIAGCVASGSTNRQVAAELHLSPKTVENRLTSIYATLGCRNRVDLARRLNERV